MKKITTNFTSFISSSKNRKIKLAALAGAMALSVLFMSCSPDSSDNNNDDKTQEELLKEKAEAEKKAREEADKAEARRVYKSLIGTWTDNYHSEYVLTEDLIKRYGDEKIVGTWDSSRFFKAEKSDLPLRDYDKIDKIFYIGDNFFYIEDANSDEIWFYDYNGGIGSSYYRVKSASGSGEGEGAGSESGNVSADLKGTYSYKPSGANQYNASITLNDNGTWTYSTEKSYSTISGGTYTVSGSKVTLKLTTPYTMEETFTVTNSGTSSTWKSGETGSSTLFPVLFGVAGTEITFTKS